VTTVLDVGSCFNPFGNVPNFETLAIDIAPADTSVKKCDFINVNVTHGECSVNEIGDMKSLKAQHFDAVIFCLLLEYLPVPFLRFRACEKAQKVLKPNSGLLVIVTPDSCHQARNLRVIRSWKICLSHLGFTRIYYEKLKHVHCMTFLKLDQNVFGNFCKLEASREAEKLGIDLDEICPENDLMIIPQDSNIDLEDQKMPSTPELPENTLKLFESLPNCDL
jgi:25S rRNA (adenine2142-N1)-methyltransferase